MIDCHKQSPGRGVNTCRNGDLLIYWAHNSVEDDSRPCAVASGWMKRWPVCPCSLARDQPRRYIARVVVANIDVANIVVVGVGEMGVLVIIDNLVGLDNRKVDEEFLWS